MMEPRSRTSGSSSPELIDSGDSDSDTSYASIVETSQRSLSPGSELGSLDVATGVSGPTSGDGDSRFIDEHRSVVHDDESRRSIVVLSDDSSDSDVDHISQSPVVGQARSPLSSCSHRSDPQTSCAEVRFGKFTFKKLDTLPSTTLGPTTGAAHAEHSVNRSDDVEDNDARSFGSNGTPTRESSNAECINLQQEQQHQSNGAVIEVEDKSGERERRDGDAANITNAGEEKVIDAGQVQETDGEKSCVQPEDRGSEAEDLTGEEDDFFEPSPVLGRAATASARSAASAAPAASAEAAADTVHRQRPPVTEQVRHLATLSPTELKKRLHQKQLIHSFSNVSALPDGGRRLLQSIADLKSALQFCTDHTPHTPPQAPPQTVTQQENVKPDRQQLEQKLRQLRMQYSTACMRAGDNQHTSAISRQIVQLEKQLMMTNLNDTLSGSSSVGTGSVRAAAPSSHTSRHVPLNKTCVSARATTDSASYNGQRSVKYIDVPAIPAHLTSSLYAAHPAVGKLYDGRMTNARVREATNVTVETLERLHQSLRSLPPSVDVDAAASSLATAAEQVTPSCLTVSLLPHQVYALTWMMWRERQEPPAGILADDMGLGKTLTVVALALRCAELRRIQSQQQQQQQQSGDTQGDRQPPSEQQEWLSKASALKDRESVTLSRATLVVCPASVLHQWQAEIERRTGGTATVTIYHGNARQVSVKRLARNDFVLTTYGIVQRELGDELDNHDVAKGDAHSHKRVGCLPSICWERAVLDEAHQVRNPATKTARAVCRIRAGRRWAVTGTLVHNRRDDVFSMMRFLRVTPFNEKPAWKRWIDTSAQGEERLALLIKALVLRRTKSDVSPVTGKPLVALPSRDTQVHMVTLSDSEKAVYEEVFEFSRAALQEFIKLRKQREYEKELLTNPLARAPADSRAPLGVKDGAGVGVGGGGMKQHHILVQLLRLRQICCHPALAKKVLETQDRCEAGLADSQRHNAGDEDQADLLGRQLERLSLATSRADPADHGASARHPAHADDGDVAGVLSQHSHVFEDDFLSAKLSVLLRVLTAVVDDDERVVVVSQWTTLLTIIGRHLDTAQLAHATISGQLSVSQRQRIVDDFNNGDASTPPVLLLSLAAGGVGLNLVGGNHVVIVDPHWNPQLEQQAADRVYRVGQTRRVRLHKLIIAGSLEERVVDLQRAKLDLAAAIVGTSGGAAGGVTLAAHHQRLTLSDLKMLFNLR